MTRLTALLDRVPATAGHTPVPLAPPTAGLVLVTCLDHRIEPARLFGLAPGDVPVIRNAGGRVTPAVVDDLTYLAFLARKAFGLTGPLFEVAVLHHTQCGTGFLADPDFRREAAAATGVPERTLAASEVADPYATVLVDVERLLQSSLWSAGVTVSGHVYDLDSGLVTTVLDSGRV